MGIDDKTETNHVETTDTSLRYAGYMARIKTLALSAKRYIAYSSDIGEGLRPLMNPRFVQLSYGVAWSYILYDSLNEAYWASKKPNATTQSNAEVFVKRLTFQSVASMLLPAITIHSAVKYSSLLLKNSSSAALKKWGPTATGLLIIPALPYLFDHPAEQVVDAAFDKFFEFTGIESHAERINDDHSHIKRD
ncbi:hypothetical protein MIR68_007298 [Amoeboaphelidium protococcarum]|nr:hypothetical protein MIR68_007298 [Amoeboaphelidium protococcarum]KAI3643920.1 hypothetical protein MP228_010084 [Amoeboaphelidium protococcarum]